MNKKGNVTKKNKKKKMSMRNKYFFALLFALGFFIMSYPFISQWYYRIESGKQIENFDLEANKLVDEEIEERIKLAMAYNSTLDSSRLWDPFTEEEKEKGVAEYARMLEVEELIGHVRIPKIDEDIPIYAGTGESILQKGAGHLEGSSLPVGGESTHAVITAHRGLPTAKLFTNLNKVQKGDVFFITNIQKTLAYEVDQILTVEPSDFEPVLVQEGMDYVTLLTCTPYMINSHRLLVRGHRVDFQNLDESIVVKREQSIFRKYFYHVFILTLLAVVLFIYQFKKHRDIKKHVGGR